MNIKKEEAHDQMISRKFSQIFQNIQIKICLAH